MIKGSIITDPFSIAGPSGRRAALNHMLGYILHAAMLEHTDALITLCTERQRCNTNHEHTHTQTQIVEGTSSAMLESN